MSKASGRTAPSPPPVPEAARPPDNRYHTLAEIAAKAGVHVTTVSLALRDHPSIPPCTRARIRQVAEAIGYRRDPLLDALNSHRARQCKHPHSTGSAFVVHSGAARLFAGSPYQPLVWEGARAAAEAHGHGLEIFQVGRGHLAPARLNSILRARGVTGILLSTFEIDINQLDLDWSQFAAIKIECLHLSPHLDCVSNDQLQVARLAVRRLRGLGYRRIGLATSHEDQTRLGESFGMGVLIEQAALCESDCVPPLFFALEDVPRLPELLRAWVASNHVDAVISNWPELFDAFAKAGMSIPGDVAFAPLDVQPTMGQVAGVQQNHRLVGQRAMEQLAIMIESNRRGVPDAQTITYIPGYWQDGYTAPARRAERALQL